MRIKRLSGNFSVCKLKSVEGIQFDREFTFFSKTEDEISLVCESNCVPECTVQEEQGWKGLKICGQLDFELVGIIARITGLLAENEVPVFVISTYDTDYIFVKAEYFECGIQILVDNGYELF